MKRLALFLLSALLPLSLYGAGSEPNEILFVRPTSVAGYGLGDGTTIDNAFNGRANVLVTGTPNTIGRLDEGDTLIVCAPTGFDEGAWNPHTGTASGRIFYDGNCAPWGYSAKVTLRNTGGSGIIVGNAATYWSWRNFIVIDNDSDTVSAVRLGNNSASTFNISLDDFEIYGTETRLASSIVSCLRLQGIGITLDDGIIDRCPNDAIYAEGQQHEITDLVIGPNIDTQLGTDGGDCIQYGDGAGASYDHRDIAIRRVQCSNMFVQVKQGIILGCDNTGGPADANIVLEDSIIRGNQNGASSVYVKYCSGVTIRRNEMGTLGIGDNTVSQVVNVESNVFAPDYIGRPRSDNASHAAVRWDTTGTTGTLNFRHNTVVGNSDYGYGLYVAPTASTITVNNQQNLYIGPFTVAAVGGRTGQTWSSLRNRFFGMSTLYAAGEVDESGAGDAQVDPKIVGGSNAKIAKDYQLNCASSTLVRAGIDVGVTRDKGGRRFNPGNPTIGAWECASGDVVTNRSVR